jgi:aminoglycoside phosphotransferase (APT) family kinase protein
LKPTAELPDDPALPGLAAIRAHGLARAMPVLGLDGRPVELLLRAYKPGARAALEARVGTRHLAIKAYAADPAPEAALYASLATVPAGDSGVHVPPLVAWDRELRALAIGWLDGPTARELIECGRGKRAGELAARWLRRAAALPVQQGPRFGAARRLEQAAGWVATLAAADPTLGTAATALAETLARTMPREGAPRLVHGSLHDRNVIDLGDGPGVIDWQRFGQGPAEIDAGRFLAEITRHRLQHEPLGAEATRAEQAFLAGIEGLVDERALAWHRAAALLRAAVRACKEIPRRQHADWLERSRRLLGEAAELAGAMS